MYTRKDYLDRKCSHSDYYSQFVAEEHKRTLLTVFGVAWLSTAYNADQHFNTISLARWDSLPAIKSSIAAKMKECGDYLTPAGVVCIYKEAARQIVSE